MVHHGMDQGGPPCSPRRPTSPTSRSIAEAAPVANTLMRSRTLALRSGRMASSRLHSLVGRSAVTTPAVDCLRGGPNDSGVFARNPSDCARISRKRVSARTAAQFCASVGMRACGQRGGSHPPAVSRSKASVHRSATTIGDAINAETRPRARVVRALANPAATSNTSLNNPALTHRSSSSVDPERRALAEPSPSARSRMPTVRINNVIDDPGGMCSQRRNRFGNPPSATPAQSRTAAIAVTDERSRLLIILGRPNPDSSRSPSRDVRATP